MVKKPIKKVAIVGGGAAGFFAAIQTAYNFPDASIYLYEKSKKLLAKVKVSGGGRCNVTNGCEQLSELVRAYPRGDKQLKKLFRVFNNKSMMEWLAARNVKLKTEPDGRVFPVSNSSQTIIDCLEAAAFEAGVRIATKTAVEKIHLKAEEKGLHIKCSDSSDLRYFDKLIIATGGSPKLSGFKWLADLGHEIVPPVPSLFTFNMPRHPITKLMGLVAQDTHVSIQGTKLKASGPLLITHWGMSGPAILKLSAFGARILAEKNYQFKVQVNWVNINNQDELNSELLQIAADHPQKQLSNYRPFGLADRLWQYLLQKSGLATDKKWSELGKKGINKLVNTLGHDVYEVNGKTTFKEEFVTCGGLSWSSIDAKHMRSKIHPDIYFAGEVVDVDGITGGYNFQAAWTTAFIAAKLG